MIEFERLTVKIGRKQIIRDVSFCVSEGQCIGLVGANGSGKSTLLKAIAGILPLAEGRILKDGRPVEKLRGKKSFIGYVPQENPLFDDARAIDHLQLYYSGSGRDLKKDLESGIPASLGIGAYLNKPVSAMSGGMKKRLSLACALAEDPALVLMDEPAAALDLPGKEQIRSYVRSLKEAGKMIILATHEEADFTLCDSFLLMSGQTAGTLNGEERDKIVNLLTAGPEGMPETITEGSRHE